MERGRDFADIAYTLLVIEKAAKIEDVAVAMGLSYASLHARLINRTCFSADEIKLLIRECRDHRMIDYLLDDSGYIPVPRPEEPRPGNPDVASFGDLLHVQRRAAQVIINATDVLEIIDAGIEGGQIDHRITRLALQSILATERALAVLRLMLTGEKTGRSATAGERPSAGTRVR